MNHFKNLGITTALITLSVFALLMIFPQMVFHLFSIDGGVSAEFMGRRAAMLFLGLSVLAWHSRNIVHSEARQAICLGLGISIFGLGLLGTTEFLRGVAGVGIIPTVVIEFALSISYFSVWVRNKNTQ